MYYVFISAALPSFVFLGYFIHKRYKKKHDRLGEHDFTVEGAGKQRQSAKSGDEFGRQNSAVKDLRLEEPSFNEIMNGQAVRDGEERM